MPKQANGNDGNSKGNLTRQLFESRIRIVKKMAYSYTVPMDQNGNETMVVSRSMGRPETSNIILTAFPRTGDDSAPFLLASTLL